MRVVLDETPAPGTTNNFLYLAGRRWSGHLITAVLDGMPISSAVNDLQIYLASIYGLLGKELLGAPSLSPNEPDLWGHFD